MVMGGGAMVVVAILGYAMVNEFWIGGKREKGILGFEKLNDFLIIILM